MTDADYSDICARLRWLAHPERLKVLELIEINPGMTGLDIARQYSTDSLELWRLAAYGFIVGDGEGYKLSWAGEAAMTLMRATRTKPLVAEMAPREA